MADLRASTKVFNNNGAGTAIPEARKYLGISLLGGSDAALVKVFKGGAATAGNEIGFASAAAGVAGDDTPGFASDVDVGAAAHGVGGIFVVVSGTTPIACIRYST